jgi:hypothetical protein
MLFKEIIGLLEIHDTCKYMWEKYSVTVIKAAVHAVITAWALKG